MIMRRINGRYKCILLAILFSSCWAGMLYTQHTDKLQGDLYFGLWRYGSFYKQPKKVVDIFEKKFKEERGDTTDRTTQHMIRIYDALKKEKLLYHPYIQFKLKNDSVVRLYLEEKEYNKIKIYRLNDLIQNGEKVEIVVKCKQFSAGLYYCKKLISVHKVKGETHQKPHKFAIEDYP